MRIRIPRYADGPVGFSLRLLPILLILFCNALCATVCSEALWRSSLSEAVFWLFSRSRFARWDVAIAFSFALLLLALTRRLSFSLTLSNLCQAALALIHYFKMTLRDEPLLLTDIDQMGEAAGVVGDYAFDLTGTKILLLAVMILLPMLISAGVRLRRVSFPYRLLSVIACALLYLFSLIQADGLYGTVRIASFNTYYFSAGVPCGLVGTRARRMAKPEAYSREAVAAALVGDAGPAVAPASAAQPDLFVIMCETLFDPARISGLEIGGEVFPRLRALQAEGYGGNLLVSQFGGGTAQTEYEVLTGYRAGDTAGTAYVTSGAMKKGMDSLATLLSGHGYYTQAIHPSDGGTYNRSKAYDRLGFDRSVFRKRMSRVTEFVGTIPADSWFFPEVLRLYEEMPADQPRFSFVVTFQNHGGYLNKTVPWTIPVSGISGDAQISAQNYVNGLHMTDEAIGAFIDALRQSGRPAVVVLFGDHAPSYSVFSSHVGTGTANAYSAHCTPLLIWSNCGLDTSSLPDTISTYRLGALIAHLLGFTDDPYYESLVSAPDLYKDDGLIAEGGKLVTDEARYSEEDARLLLLHYDRLQGEGYARQPAR